MSSSTVTRAGNPILSASRCATASVISVIFPLLILVCTETCFAQTPDRVFEREGSPYRFDADLIVPFGDVWHIEAGTHLCFEHGTALKVDGILVAKGTHEQRISFTPCDAETSWSGIRFIDSRQLGNMRSTMRYILIEGARNVSNDSSGFDRSKAGGGLFVERSDLEVTNAIIRRNQAEIGGGIYIGTDSDVVISRSAIYDNSALGSNYIYSGGGGLYVAGPRRLDVSHSVIALNRFLGRNLQNEEGGGGIYVSHGPINFTFNLVIGNSSGKGAGMQILSQGHSQKPRAFTANIFVYNYGSLNFEQVALQTRHSYTVPWGVGEWSLNAGQTPFVAHLNRNRLSSYYYKGSKAFLELLQPGSEVEFGSQIEDQGVTARTTGLDHVPENRNLCGQDIDIGPIEICGNGFGRKLSEYFSTIGDIFESELGALLAERFAPPAVGSLTEDDRTRLGPLVAAAPRVHEPGEPVPDPLDGRLVDLVFGNSSQRDDAIDSIATASETAPKRGEMSAVVLAKVLGFNKYFDILVSKSRPSIATLHNAVKFGNDEVALALLNSPRYVSVMERKNLYDLLQRASYANLVEVVEELLNSGIKPNVPLHERLALTIAVREGHLDTVQLLLRRGADPNAHEKIHSSDAEPVPILAHAIGWYHLGAGHREIAELLVAAGANLAEQELPESIRTDALRLKSALELGVISTDEAAAVAASWPPTEGYRRRIQQEIVDRTVTPHPVLSNVRELRQETAETLTAVLAEDDAPPARRAAASRILAVRNFQITATLRSNLLAAFRNQTANAARDIWDLERILKFRILSSVSSNKGAPNRINSEVESSNPAELQTLPYGRKFALVVGISDYEELPSRTAEPDIMGQYYDLAFAEEDGKAVDSLLTSGRLGDGWEITTLLGRDATKAQVERVMKLLRNEVEQGDLVLFFFSGHGFTEVGEFDKNYFFLHDSKLGAMKETALSFAEVREWAIALESRHALLLLDACRSGAIGSAKGDRNLVTYDMLDDRRIRQDAGKIALTSSIGTQLSYEWTSRRLGFFTATLLDVINQRVTTLAQGPFITVLNVFRSLQSNVIDRSTRDKFSRTQIPHYVLLNGSDLLDFPIALNW